MRSPPSGHRGETGRRGGLAGPGEGRNGSAAVVVARLHPTRRGDPPHLHEVTALGHRGDPTGRRRRPPDRPGVHPHDPSWYAAWTDPSGRPTHTSMRSPPLATAAIPPVVDADPGPARVYSPHDPSWCAAWTDPSGRSTTPPSGRRPWPPRRSPPDGAADPGPASEYAAQASPGWDRTRHRPSAPTHQLAADRLPTAVTRPAAPSEPGGARTAAPAGRGRPRGDGRPLRAPPDVPVGPPVGPPVGSPRGPSPSPRGGTSGRRRRCVSTHREPRGCRW